MDCRSITAKLSLQCALQRDAKELKPGVVFCYRGVPVVVKDLTGTFVGPDGVQYDGIARNHAKRFFLPGEMDPYVPEKVRNDKPAGKGPFESDRIFVKRNGSLYSVFSHNLNVGTW